MEGIGDEYQDGSPRGWADRVAEGLATRLDEPVYYANFAIRGRILKPIATQQLDAALALDPKPDVICPASMSSTLLPPSARRQAFLSCLSPARVPRTVYRLPSSWLGAAPPIWTRRAIW